MIKAIFFDLDGVLTLDKTGTITESKYFANKTGIDFQKLFEHKCKFDQREDSDKLKTADIWKFICEKCAVEFNPDWIKEAFKSAPIDDKMVAIAKKLKRKYKIGIITDNKAERVKVIVEQNNLKNLFESIVVSSEVGSTKRQPKIFEVAMQSLGVKPEECIFIDNSQRNVDIARQVGMLGIYFDDEVRDYSEIDKLVNNVKSKEKLL
ncbi:MAG: HAD family phosphatase [Oscillospiraceae bacterium]|nr:HAD family phosphatase [Oscillospiraceae bacterium]